MLKNRLAKVILLVLLFVVVLSAGSVVFAEDTYRIVKADCLNIRQQASTDATVVGMVPYAGKVKILGLEPDWARVSYEGIEGYVARRYLVVPSEFVYKMPSRGTSVTSKGDAVAEFAKKYLGVPYVYGGTSPNGFDCSGLVYYVYKQFGVTLNRVAADQMANGAAVSVAEMRPGDIVGFHNKSGYVNHIGIYVGGGMMIHAPQSGETVRLESVVTGNYSRRISGVRRIFN